MRTSSPSCVPGVGPSHKLTNEGNAPYSQALDEEDTEEGHAEELLGQQVREGHGLASQHSCLGLLPRLHRPLLAYFEGPLCYLLVPGNPSGQQHAIQHCFQPPLCLCTNKVCVRVPQNLMVVHASARPLHVKPGMAHGTAGRITSWWL